MKGIGHHCPSGLSVTAAGTLLQLPLVQPALHLPRASSDIADIVIQCHSRAPQHRSHWCPPSCFSSCRCPQHPGPQLLSILYIWKNVPCNCCWYTWGPDTPQRDGGEIGSHYSDGILVQKSFSTLSFSAVKCKRCCQPWSGG